MNDRVLIRPGESYAYVAGRLATGLREVSTDPAVLESSGYWAVVGTFEGSWTFARFAHVERRPHPRCARPWPEIDQTAWESSLTESTFMRCVEEVRDRIATGEVYQVNLCRVVSAPLPAHTDLTGLSERLAVGNPAPFAARVAVPEAGVDVVSASPELFLRRVGSQVSSAPIKGTGRRTADLSAKDVAENVMIVDLVRNDLGRVCEPGSIVVDDALAVEHHPGLVHLVSTVRGRLRSSTSWCDLLAATFPPGSVSGAPKHTDCQPG